MLLTMQPKIFYRARQAGHDVFIDGYFYNGGFYRRHQLLGQIEEDARLVMSKGMASRPVPNISPAMSGGWC